VILGAVVVATPAGADREEDLERLRDAISDRRERVAEYEREQRGLLEAVEALDRSAALLTRDVERARRAADRARQDVRDLEAEAEAISKTLDGTRRSMRTRAVALYKAGDVGAVRLLFSSGGLREFLSRVYGLRRLLAHDRSLIERHEAQSMALVTKQEQARKAVGARDQATERLGTRSAQLAAERRAKRRLAEQLLEDRTRERSALVELETAARALEQTLSGLDDDDGSAPDPTPGISFASLRGALAHPVDAPIAHGFGRVVDRENQTQTFRKGVEYEAPLGETVRAVAAGRVRFAGWFRGYGRLVIVDHGDSYYSVSGHLDEMEVEAGESVDAEDAIGEVGETGSLRGPLLYFELRKGGEPLDPALWLAPRAGLE
jgi:septal ring factor EnvC (AmiA/AmiB activator)